MRLVLFRLQSQAMEVGEKRAPPKKVASWGVIVRQNLDSSPTAFRIDAYATLWLVISIRAWLATLSFATGHFPQPNNIHSLLTSVFSS